jgi:hypothetical protein
VQLKNTRNTSKETEAAIEEISKLQEIFQEYINPKGIPITDDALLDTFEDYLKTAEQCMSSQPTSQNAPASQHTRFYQPDLKGTEDSKEQPGITIGNKPTDSPQQEPLNIKQTVADLQTYLLGKPLRDAMSKQRAGSKAKTFVKFKDKFSKATAEPEPESDEKNKADQGSKNTSGPT